MFIAFGITFEVPVAVVILCKFEVVSVEKLRSMRPYVIVVAFIIGGICTPPDVVSQFLLAIPLWILYEIGIFISVWTAKNTNLKKIEKE